MVVKSSSKVMPQLPTNWATEWGSTGSMAFFLAEDMDTSTTFWRIYVVNKETLSVYHVSDFDEDTDFANSPLSCAFCDGKLYMVGDRGAEDVHVCDLTTTPNTNNNEPRYVWKKGPPMHYRKDQALLVPFKSMVFAISNPVVDQEYPPGNPEGYVSRPRSSKTPVVISFEVWDTRNECGGWEVLPDPPFPNYNNYYRAYRVMSYAVLDDLLYFVFDDYEYDENDYDSESGESFPDFRKRIKTFDPKLKQWVSTCDDYKLKAWYVDLCARRSLRGVSITEFVDPSMRCFLIDPQEIGELSTPPCFYSFARSSFDINSPNSLGDVLKAYSPPDSANIDPKEFLIWFQLYMRPHLSPIRGLRPLAEELMWEYNLRNQIFYLPSYHQGGGGAGGDSYWIVRVVAFRYVSSSIRAHQCIVASFRLLSSNVFEAKDLRINVQTLGNMSLRPVTQFKSDQRVEFFRIP